jgi:hypothetical protein
VAIKVAAYEKGNMGLCIHMDAASKAYFDRMLGGGPINVEVLGSQQLRVFRDPAGDLIEEKTFFKEKPFAWQRNASRVNGFHKLVEQGLSDIENTKYVNGDVIINMATAPKPVKRCGPKPVKAKTKRKHSRPATVVAVRKPAAQPVAGELLVAFAGSEGIHRVFTPRHANLVRALLEQLDG